MGKAFKYTHSCSACLYVVNCNTLLVGGPQLSQLTQQLMSNSQWHLQELTAWAWSHTHTHTHTQTRKLDLKPEIFFFSSSWDENQNVTEFVWTSSSFSAHRINSLDRNKWVASLDCCIQLYPHQCLLPSTFICSLLSPSYFLHPLLSSPYPSPSPSSSPLLSSLHSEGLTDGLPLIKQSCASQPNWLQSAWKKRNKWSDKITSQRPLLQSEWWDGWMDEWPLQYEAISADSAEKEKLWCNHQVKGLIPATAWCPATVLSHLNTRLAQADVQ